MERGDVDAGLAQGAAEIADEARLVAVAHEQHVRPQLGLERYALDVDDARPVAAEQRASDAARAVLALDRDADQRLEIRRLGAAGFADTAMSRSLRQIPAR